MICAKRRHANGKAIFGGECSDGYFSFLLAAVTARTQAAEQAVAFSTDMCDNGQQYPD